MTIVLRNLPDYTEITLAAPVQASSIYTLCDALDAAASQYYYEHVKLRIASPGGETQALRYYLSHLHEWYRRGITIETQAMTECSSAAAIMLSLGSRGFRRADQRHSRLLWHFARMPSDAVLSREANKHAGGLTARAGAAVVKQLAEVQEIIKRDDDYMLDVLLDHICGGHTKSPDAWFAEEFLKRKYFLQQHLESSVQHASKTACHWSAKDEHSIRVIWDQLYRDVSSPEEAAAFLEVEVRTLFDADRYCSPLEAWALFLIDDFGGMHV